MLPGMCERISLRPSDCIPGLEYIDRIEGSLIFQIVADTPTFRRIVLEAMRDIEQRVGPAQRIQRKNIIDALAPDTIRVPASPKNFDDTVRNLRNQDSQRMYRILKRASVNIALAACRPPINGLGVLDSLVREGLLRKERPSGSPERSNYRHYSITDLGPQSLENSP